MSLPPAYPINQIELDTATQGKIVNVNLYISRAEVSRSYDVKVASGQNRVFVYGLPNLLDQSSLRVEGRGKATIQDVTVSFEPFPQAPTTSAKLRDLQDRRDDLDQALSRCSKTLEGLDQYLKSLDIQHTRAAALLPIVDDYNDAAEKYDRKTAELRKALKRLEEEISDETKALASSVQSNTKCLIKASIGLFADAGGIVELVLKYGISNANWSALYDVRVATEAKGNTVEIVYKAAISQRTGEDWNDVPVTLETASPTFGLSLPTLNTWPLSVYKPHPASIQHSRSSTLMRLAGGKKRKKSKSAVQEEFEEAEESDNDMGFGIFDDGPGDPLHEHAMAMAMAAVTSAGGVNATFRVAGLISIPADGLAHNVTIAKLNPEASLLWLAVPSVDTRVHLSTSIKNTSEYTLLPGDSSVFVDGSFISKSKIPLVSPQESFTCALGLDPSIRVTYHPRIKKSTQSGLLTKTSSTSFHQRISVYNSKAVPIDHFKVTDRIPVAQDSQITIKLVSPGLILPHTGATGLAAAAAKDLANKTRAPVQVADGVVAQWFGADGEVTSSASGGNGSESHLGKDGKIQWVCSLEPQKKVDLLLQWEVSFPSQTIVTGL